MTHCIVGILLVLLFSACGETQQDPQPSESLKATDTDDGTWVVRINDKVVTRDEFELSYRLFLELAAFQTGNSLSDLSLRKDELEYKRLILDKMINSELAFQKILSESLLQEDELRDLLELYRKEALYQYYLFKELGSKVEDPSDEELKDFYTQYTQEIRAQTAIKDFNIKEHKTLLKFLYRQRRAQIESQQKLDMLVLEKRIQKNLPALEGYITNKHTREEIIRDPERFWILKVDDRTIKLSQLTYFIDFQMRQYSTSPSQGMHMLANEMLALFKFIELGYVKALERGYHREEKAQHFISLTQKRSLALYYLVKEITSKLAYPKDTDVKKLLKDPKRVQKAKSALKQSNQKFTEQNLLNFLKGQVHQEAVLTAHNQFIDQLREAHSIKISTKYFESAAEKLQKTIIQNTSK